MELNHLADMLEAMKTDLAPFDDVANLSRTVLRLAGQIDDGIQKYGLGDNGATYAYEADGYARGTPTKRPAGVWLRMGWVRRSELPSTSPL